MTEVHTTQSTQSQVFYDNQIKGVIYTLYLLT